MARYKQHNPNADGWSDWETPVMEGYRLACCDCGLVHVVDFQALKITRHNPDGTWQADHLDTGKYRVHFRVRRNNRATGQIRRHMRKDAP